MVNYAFAAMVLLLVASSHAKYYKDCGSKKGSIESVSVKGCSDSDSVCTLRRGKAAEIDIKFKSATDSSTVTASVHGLLFGMELPFPLDNANGCQSGVTCPIKSGQSYTYKKSIQIRSFYPPIKVDVKYELKDDKKADIVCVLITGKVA